MSFDPDPSLSELIIPPPSDFADAAPGSDGDSEADREFFDKYFCDVGRSQAAKMLHQCDADGAFVVRPGSSSPFCVSFLHAGDINHVKVKQNAAGQCFLGDTNVQTPFNSMSELMQHLTKNVIQGTNGIVFRLTLNAKPYAAVVARGGTQRRHSNRSCRQSASSEQQQQQQPRRKSSVTSFTGGGGFGGGGDSPRRLSRPATTASSSHPAAT